MTLYLKYRPQKISDLDLKEVRESLAKLLQSKDLPAGRQGLPHAFLFTGPRGTGKTSSARILAKALNCQKKKSDGEPCNSCEVCIGITDGSATDLIEVDAASNRGIDEIRALRDNIKLAPMNLKYKVYIIDEVHMLTTEAANALLKTLEEPPAHAIFILCTTDPQKLPDTVVSRCTQVNFKMPTQEEAIERLDKIVEGEKIKADKMGLQLVAKAGRGSFRDEVKILEQIWLTKGDVTENSVRKSLDLLMSADPDKFIELWKENSTDELLTFINDLVQHGVNLRTFVERVVENLRQELLTTRSAESFSMIERLDRAYEQMRTSAIAQLPLEMMVLEGQMVNPKPQNLISQTVDKPQEEKVETLETIKKEIVVEEVKEVIKPIAPGKYKLADVLDKWSDILKDVRPKNHSVEALLRSTAPMDFNGQDLVLEVFYKFHKDKLETEKCRQIVEQSVQNVFGVNPIHLKLRLGTKQKSSELSGDAIGEDLVKAAAEIFKVDAV